MITVTEKEHNIAHKEVTDKFLYLLWERYKVNRVGGDVSKIQPRLEASYLYMLAISRYRQGVFEVGEFNNYITQGQMLSILTRTNEL